MNVQEKFVALKTILEKEVIRILRIWPQTIMPPIITTSLYFIIFGEILFKDRIITISGVNIAYSDYLIPGLIIMAIINNAYNNSAFSFSISKFHKNIEEIIVAPMPVSIVILGFALGGVVRGLINGLMIFVTVMLFKTIDVYSITITIFIAFLTAMFFSLAGTINAVFAKTFDDISWFPGFILTPMMYLGGIFFSIDMLPNNWRLIAQLNPIYHFVNIFRYNLLGIGEFLSMSLIGIILANILLFALTVLAFKKKMQK